MKPQILSEFLELKSSHPTFARLMLADGLLLLTELMVAVILPWWIYSKGGAVSLAAYSAIMAVATFVVLPVAAPVGERLCKIRQMKLGLVALVVVGMILMAYIEAASFDLMVIGPLGAIQIAAMAFANQARSTILPEVVSPEHLPTALRIRKTFQALGGILGPLIAGFALSEIGVLGAFGIYASLVLLALLLVTRIMTATPPYPVGTGGIRQWWNDFADGMVAKWKMPMERGWTIVNFIVWIFQGPAAGILIPIKVQSLKLSGNWLGLSLGALAAGTLLGSVFGAQLLVRLFGRYRVRVGLGFMEGIFLAIVGLAGSPYIMIAALFLSGFCNAAMSLVGATHRALAIPQHYRVRMFAVSSMTTQIAGVIGPLVVGITLTRWDISHVYTAFGLLMAASVLGFMWVPRFKEFLGIEHAHIVDWYAINYPRLFPRQP